MSLDTYWKATPLVFIVDRCLPDLSGGMASAYWRR